MVVRNAALFVVLGCGFGLALFVVYCRLFYCGLEVFLFVSYSSACPRALEIKLENLVNQFSPSVNRVWKEFPPFLLWRIKTSW